MSSGRALAKLVPSPTTASLGALIIIAVGAGPSWRPWVPCVRRSAHRCWLAPSGDGDVTVATASHTVRLWCFASHSR
jgi:hypothetical protein